MLPAELSITQLAAALGLSRRQIAYRVKHGTVPAYRVGSGARAKHVVSTEQLRKCFPELYEALLGKAYEGDIDDDE